MAKKKSSFSNTKNSGNTQNPVKPATKRSFRLVSPFSSSLSGTGGTGGTGIQRIEELLEAEGFVLEEDILAPWARRLSHEPFPLGRSLAARFGMLYIQDRSSMLPPLALNPAPGSVVLDMCASPGSKTGQLAQMVGPKGLVLGNEPSKSRLPVLRSNLEHLNLWHAVTSSYKAEAYPLSSGVLEQIQLDPPCSGWGTQERNPKVMEIWKGEKTKTLVHLQRTLLREAARMLAVGGRLVYSTCTTNVEENEEQVIWAVENLGLELVPLPPAPGFRLADPGRADCDGVWRVENHARLAGLAGMEGQEGLDDEPQGQGFFVACLRKRDVFATSALPDKVLARLAGVSGTAPGFSPAFPGIERCDAAVLADFGYDPSLLPPGDLGIFGRELHCLPKRALKLLPSAVEWRGLVLGKYGNSGFKPSNNLRSLMPPLAVAEQAGQALCLEKPEDLRNLLNGLSFESRVEHEGSRESGKFRLLYYKDLPLCRLMRKGNRVLYGD